MVEHDPVNFSSPITNKRLFSAGFLKETRLPFLHGADREVFLVLCFVPMQQ